VGARVAALEVRDRRLMSAQEPRDPAAPRNPSRVVRELALVQAVRAAQPEQLEAAVVGMRGVGELRRMPREIRVSLSAAMPATTIA